MRTRHTVSHRDHVRSYDVSEPRKRTTNEREYQLLPEPESDPALS